VSETTPTADTTNNPRTERLVKAEQNCLNAGGCCLRLAGLYDITRGAHNYWITSGKSISSSPDGMVNLLHYHDAAGACLAALKAGADVIRGKVFLISDNHPLSRYAICEYALQAKVYQKYDMPEFTGNDEQPWAKGKIYDVSKSMATLNWQPYYPSFEEFMESHS
jgi:nucleoside-diphosphate-sugar epimerase